MFKSERQKAKFQQLLKEGRMSQETFDRFAKDTPDKLPERVSKPKSDKQPRPKKRKLIKYRRK